MMKRNHRLMMLTAVTSIALTFAAPGTLVSSDSALARGECETALPDPSPARALSASDEAQIETLLGGMSLEVKVGQMLVAGVTGTTADDDARAIIDELH